MTRNDDAAGRAVYRTALRLMGWLLGAMVVIGVPLAALLDGWPAVWSVLIGVGLTLVFSGTTVISVSRTLDEPPMRMVAVVLMAWLAKLVVVFVTLAVLSRFGFYHRLTLGAVLLVGVVGSALLDYRAVTSTRVPYVDPPADHDPPAGVVPPAP